MSPCLCACVSISRPLPKTHEPSRSADTLQGRGFFFFFLIYRIQKLEFIMEGLVAGVETEGSHLESEAQASGGGGRGRERTQNSVGL